MNKNIYVEIAKFLGVELDDQFTLRELKGRYFSISKNGFYVMLYGGCQYTRIDMSIEILDAINKEVNRDKRRIKKWKK